MFGFGFAFAVCLALFALLGGANAEQRREFKRGKSLICSNLV